MTRCSVPECGGVECTTQIIKETLWDNFYTDAPQRQRHFAERLQNSQESLKAIADHYHINIKTVAKRRKRTTITDQPMGSHQPHSTVLTTEQEAITVAFRRQALLPLDDCLYALHPQASRI